MSNANENKMGVMPVNKLLITMSVPLMISMLIQALYNIVDSMFVSYISKEAFEALSFAFPIQNLLIAVAVGTGVGVNALLSRKLGEKDFEGANKIATNGVFIAICSYIVFAAVTLPVLEWFFKIQTPNAIVIEYGVEYLFICCAGSIAVFVQIMFERLMQATGKTVLVLCSHTFGAVINIILDPIFIFVFEMDVIGAALATVIGQFGGMVLAIFMHHRKNCEVRLSIRGFRPCGKTILNIYKIALPSIVMQSIGSVMVFTFNNVIKTLSDAAVRVFGVYFKIQSFVFMPVIGMNNGMVPIIGYNYGAKKRERIIGVIKYASVYALIIMTVGMAVFVLLPNVILYMFNADAEMLKIGPDALRVISGHFLFASISIVLSSTFQAFGHAWKSMMVSIARQLVVLIPAAWLLSLTGNIFAVWWAFPIAEVFSLALCIVFFVGIYKKIIMKV